MREARAEASWWLGLGLVGRLGGLTVGAVLLHPSLGKEARLLVLPLWGPSAGKPSEEALLTAALLARGGFGGRQVLAEALRRGFSWMGGASRVWIDGSLAQRLAASPHRQSYEGLLGGWRLPAPFGPKGDLEPLAGLLGGFMRKKALLARGRAFAAPLEGGRTAVFAMGESGDEAYGLRLVVGPGELPPWQSEVLEALEPAAPARVP